MLLNSVPNLDWVGMSFSEVSSRSLNSDTKKPGNEPGFSITSKQRRPKRRPVMRASPEFEVNLGGWTGINVHV